MSYLDCTGELNIGNDVSIAHGTTIMTSSHNYSKDTIPIKDQGMSYKKVVIEDNVWIGAKVIILYGLLIKQGTIIAANSTVTKDVISNVIVAGSPAKILKYRNES